MIPFLSIHFQIRPASCSSAASTPVSLITVYLCATSGVCSPAQVNEPQPRASPANQPPRPHLSSSSWGWWAGAPPPAPPLHSSVSLIQFIVDVTLLCFGPLVAVVLHDSMFLSPSDVTQRSSVTSVCPPSTPLPPLPTDTRFLLCPLQVKTKSFPGSRWGNFLLSPTTWPTARAMLTRWAASRWQSGSPVRRRW